MMITWGAYIAIYLFLGGVAAGCFTSAALLDLYGKDKYREPVKWGAYWSWVLMAVGIALLVIDLGRPERAFNPILHPNLLSPMGGGSLIINVFMILALIYWLIYTRIPRMILGRDLTVLRLPVIYLGCIFAFMTGAYTGILLSYGSPPMWATSSLGILFLASALATGYALFLLIWAIVDRKSFEELHPSLGRIEAILGTLELLALLQYTSVIPLKYKVALLGMRNPYSAVFMSVFVLLGILIGEIGLPLFMTKPRKGLLALLCLSVALVLIGGFVLRYVVIYLGQITA